NSTKKVSVSSLSQKTSDAVAKAQIFNTSTGERALSSRPSAQVAPAEPGRGLGAKSGLEMREKMASFRVSCSRSLKVFGKSKTGGKGDDDLDRSESASSDVDEETLFFKNEDIYQGPLKDGVPNGRGELFYENGTFYRGEFEAGKASGSGELSFPNGDSFTGKFAGGGPGGDGQIRVSLSDGSVYEGELVAWEPTGSGSILYANGDFYEGEVLCGVPRGLGEFNVFKDGSRKTGLF
ncbi:MAG: hypothetical protein ACI9BD_000756, partial [Candidatus Marinamargulisbacteria bacterium]